MSDALLRQWHMLRLLPRAPRKVDTASIEGALNDRGFDIDRRSIQRDLMGLSATFPIECDSRSKPFGWSWGRDAVPFDLPAMDVHAALAFRVAAEHLKRLLPATTRSHLEPYFRQAQMQLANVRGALADWPENVRAIHTGPPLLSPHVDQGILECVHESLIDERRLSVRYKRRGAQQLRTYELSPLGLVYRDGVAMLVASVGEYDDALQFAIHRVASAQLKDTPRRVPPGFTLQKYIDAGEFDFLLSDAPLVLVADVDEAVVVKLTETPLSEDQRLEPQRDGRTRLTATVADTNQLRAWLRSFGAFIEVVSPPDLRATMAAGARELAARYAEERPSA